jgi:DNA polymerase (family 10)
VKLHPAIKLAEAVQRELQPFCSRIEIAGSIRRARPEVGDIDFVILAKSPADYLAIKERCKQKCRVITDGRQNFICAMKVKDGSEFQIDIFFAHSGVDDLLAPEPTNFGSLLLCRTGSKGHNIKIAQRAKDLGMHWNPYKGLFAGGMWELDGQESVYRGGQLIAGETEESIFKALGLECIAPALRETTYTPGPTAEQICAPETVHGSTPIAHTASVSAGAGHFNAVQGDAAQ